VTCARGFGNAPSSRTANPALAHQPRCA
jgi:hypothetical protein